MQVRVTVSGQRVCVRERERGCVFVAQTEWKKESLILRRGVRKKLSMSNFPSDESPPRDFLIENKPK